VRAAANHATYVPSPQGAPDARTADVYVVHVEQAAQRGFCPNGQHIYIVNYGLFGILCAIVFFPVGILCLLADKKRVCTRCGFVLEI